MKYYIEFFFLVLYVVMIIFLYLHTDTTVKVIIYMSLLVCVGLGYITYKQLFPSFKEKRKQVRIINECVDDIIFDYLNRSREKDVTP